MFGLLTPPPIRADITDQPATPAWILWFKNLADSLNLSQRVISNTKITAAATTVVVNSGITSNFNNYMMDFINLTMSNATPTISLTVSTDYGVTYLAGTNYKYIVQGYDGVTLTTANSTGAASVPLMITSTANGATNLVCGTLELLDPSNSTTQKMINWTIQYLGSSGNLASVWGTIQVTTISPITAIKFTASAGNITAGRVLLRGTN